MVGVAKLIPFRENLEFSVAYDLVDTLVMTLEQMAELTQNLYSLEQEEVFGDGGTKDLWEEPVKEVQSLLFLTEETLEKRCPCGSGFEMRENLVLDALTA